MVFVTFRCDNEKLTSMFMGGGFRTVEEAKEFIERDAEHFLSCHHASNEEKICYRQKRGWRNPNNEDYYEVRAQDGTICVWQYFNRV